MFRKRNILLVLGLGCMLFALSILFISNDRNYEISSKVRDEEAKMLFEQIFNNANETDLDIGYVENAIIFPAHDLKYVTISFVTIDWNLGLGNVLFEAFFLLMAASQLNLIPAYDSSLTFDRLLDYPALNNLFVNANMLSNDVISLSHSGACCTYRPLNMSELEKNVPGKTTLRITGHFFQSYKYFSRKRDVIRKLLEPTTKLKSGVEEEIDKIDDEDRENIRNNNVHKVCIHIRRSDYIHSKIYWFTRSTFTLVSANYLGEKYGINKSIAIVAIGDSMDWANTVLSDFRDKNWTVVAFPRMDQAVTIALTQTYCDTLLLTAPTSTFGFWMAYTLKEGAHVYRGEDFSPPGGIENDTAIDDIAPPEWKVLRFNQSTLQVRELTS